MAQHVDDLCLLKGMHTEGVAHGPSTLFMHSGTINLIRPSMERGSITDSAPRMKICRAS